MEYTQEEMQAFIDVLALAYLQSQVEGMVDITMKITKEIPDALFENNLTTEDVVEYLKQKYVKE